MSKRDKLITRLLEVPADFTWAELVTLLKALGYQETQGSGSRVKFDNGRPEQLINLHKPHPGSIVKRYALRQLIDKLKQAELI
jgi:predicted RNA binding protein YcfA (HicA-like mRNA interferase family)